MSLSHWMSISIVECAARFWNTAKKEKKEKVLCRGEKYKRHRWGGKSQYCIWRLLIWKRSLLLPENQTVDGGDVHLEHIEIPVRETESYQANAKKKKSSKDKSLSSDWQLKIHFAGGDSSENRRKWQVSVMLVKQMTDCTNAGPDSICTVKLMAEESGGEERRRGKTERDRGIKGNKNLWCV